MSFIDFNKITNSLAKAKEIEIKINSNDEIPEDLFGIEEEKPEETEFSDNSDFSMELPISKDEQIELLRVLLILSIIEEFDSGEEDDDEIALPPMEVTTQAIGEEGGELDEPTPRDMEMSTDAVGEEGGFATTHAIGEEGGEGQNPDIPINVTTAAVGEDGNGHITTDALGEEGGFATTHAIGEEGGQDSQIPIDMLISTDAVGEEGGQDNQIPIDMKTTTMAIGEEGGEFDSQIPRDMQMSTDAVGEEGGN